jgi:hypothetical protein
LHVPEVVPTKQTHIKPGQNSLINEATAFLTQEHVVWQMQFWFYTCMESLIILVRGNKGLIVKILYFTFSKSKLEFIPRQISGG